jgi:hypothetical protein
MYFFPLSLMMWELESDMEVHLVEVHLIKYISFT